MLSVFVSTLSLFSSLVQDLIEGKHEVNAGDYPAFLYTKNGADYDSKKIVNGLLRGYFLLRVGRLRPLF